jgi:hypothetical protein
LLIALHCVIQLQVAPTLRVAFLLQRNYIQTHQFQSPFLQGAALVPKGGGIEQKVGVFIEQKVGISNESPEYLLHSTSKKQK